MVEVASKVAERVAVLEQAGPALRAAQDARAAEAAAARASLASESRRADAAARECATRETQLGDLRRRLGARAEARADPRPPAACISLHGAGAGPEARARGRGQEWALLERRCFGAEKDASEVRALTP
jgi:hypothetical protein